MNKSPAVRAKLTQSPPEWLKIGAPCAAKLAGDPKNVIWSRYIVTDSQNQPDSSAKPGRKPVVEVISKRVNGDVLIGSYGSSAIAVPQPLGDLTKGALALVNDSRNMVLVRSQIYSIAGGTLLQESGQPVPELNFDDSRRSVVTWETWMSDTRLLGTMVEEAIEEFPVRSVLYLYDVSTRTMRRISLPESVTAAYLEGDPTIQVVAVAHDSILVKVGGWGGTGKDFVLVLQP